LPRQVSSFRFYITPLAAPFLRGTRAGVISNESLKKKSGPLLSKSKTPGR
jgi:hypothetical protein